MEVRREAGTLEEPEGASMEASEAASVAASVAASAAASEAASRGRLKEHPMEYREVA